MNPLDYVSTPAPDDCDVKISPSSFGTFIEKPWNWYRQQVLGLDKFEYSTSSVIGSIVHYVAEQVALNKEVNEEAIEEYIEKHKENETYVKEDVRINWYDMASVLVNDYTLVEQGSILEAEMQGCAKVSDRIYTSGTLDLLQGTKEDCMLVDYKTYNSKSKPKSISSVYRYQLLTYVWILRKLGYNVNRIRLVFVNRAIDGGLSEKTGKPLKSYPPEITVLTEVVNEEDIVFIEKQLELCSDSINATKKHPELCHVIWHDMRNKEK
jgi:hypothetical protein